MNKEQKKLLEDAKIAAKQAYAPYSNFHVGAAILTNKGVFIGANIENSSSNLGICAERVAISHARMHGAETIVGIAINCSDAPKDDNGNVDLLLTIPCGGCRQWIAELAPDAWIVTNGSDKVFSITDLLPTPFTLKV